MIKKIFRGDKYNSSDSSSWSSSSDYSNESMSNFGDNYVNINKKIKKLFLVLFIFIYYIKSNEKESPKKDNDLSLLT